MERGRKTRAEAKAEEMKGMEAMQTLQPGEKVFWQHRPQWAEAREWVFSLEEIRKEQRDQKVAPIGGYVFTWGGRTMSEGWKRAFQMACQKAGMKDFRFHDLRHTFVTRQVREGWDYRRILAITSRKILAVFQQYNSLSEEDLKAVALASPPEKMVG